MSSAALQPSKLHTSQQAASRLNGYQLREPDNGRYELGWPGLNPKRPCLDLIVFDHSGSVTAVGGADPIGNRFGEAWRAIKTVSDWSNGKVLAGVLSFDQPSSGNVKPGRLSDSRHLAMVRAALRVPQDAYGTSNLAPSLSQAEQIAADYPEHDVRLTILSDFELLDPDPADIFKRLAAFPGTVHAVILNREAPPDLRGENIVITRINHGDQPGSLATAIHASLTASRPGRRSGSVRVDTQPSIPPLSPDNLSPKRAVG